MFIHFSFLHRTSSQIHAHSRFFNQFHVSIKASYFSYHFTFVAVSICLGQDRNGRRTPQRTQERYRNGLDSDDEHETSPMFEANYIYTPLKDFAATRSNRTTSENNIKDDSSK